MLSNVRRWPPIVGGGDVALYIVGILGQDDHLAFLGGVDHDLLLDGAVSLPPHAEDVDLFPFGHGAEALESRGCRFRHGRGIWREGVGLRKGRHFPGVNMPWDNGVVKTSWADAPTATTQVRAAKAAARRGGRSRLQVS